MYRNIVVAYDGSEGARAALWRASEIATAEGATLTLAQSVDETTAAPIPGGRRGAKVEAAAEVRHALDEAIASLDDSLAASPWVVAGPPAKGILAVAEDVEADLIVTGSRKHGRIARRMLGSVSSALVHEAPCDVLVVHPRAA